MKNIPSFDDFLNEAVVSSMQMEMKGTTIINKIRSGAKFELEVDGKPETYTVTGFGDRANAFKIFEVESSEGKTTWLKVTVMYGCKYQIMDNSRGNWENSKSCTLKSLTI